MAWLAKSRIFYDGDIDFTCLRFCFNTVVKIASMKVKNHVRFVSEEKRFHEAGIAWLKIGLFEVLESTFSTNLISYTYIIIAAIEFY